MKVKSEAKLTKDELNDLTQLAREYRSKEVIQFVKHQHQSLIDELDENSIHSILFNHFVENHGLILIQSEMDDIINIVKLNF